ncbi:hypothetical protein ACWEQL_03780 [Kitasatospora sp. NPDC004240]
MRLDKSRKALALAEKYLAVLEELHDDPEEFQASFVGAIGVIRRVGHVVNDELKKLGLERTSTFGQWWWGQANNTPLYQCIKSARDLVYKEAEEVTQVHHEVNVADTPLGVATAYPPSVSTETHIDVAAGGEPTRYTFTTPSVPPQAAERPARPTPEPGSSRAPNAPAK